MCNEKLDTRGFVSGPVAFREAVVRRRQALRDRLAEAFPVPRPTVLELGSGHGHFLTAYAATHCEHYSVGVDLIGERVRRALKKRERAGLENLAFFQCEATEFLESLPEEVRFDRVFVLFPDPWPKKRHHKNRLLSARFFGTLAGCCAPGAEFFFRTDHEPYFAEVEKVLASHRDWGLTDTGWPFDEPTVFQQRAEVFYSLSAERA